MSESTRLGMPFPSLERCDLWQSHTQEEREEGREGASERASEGARERGSERGSEGGRLLNFLFDFFSNEFIAIVIYVSGLPEHRAASHYCHRRSALRYRASASPALPVLPACASRPASPASPAGPASLCQPVPAVQREEASLPAVLGRLFEELPVLPSVLGPCMGVIRVQSGPLACLSRGPLAANV